MSFRNDPVAAGMLPKERTLHMENKGRFIFIFEGAALDKDMESLWGRH